MAITSLNDYIASEKQVVAMGKAALITTIAGATYNHFAVAGSVYASSAVIGDTTSGVVPVSNDPGYPTIESVGGSPKYYITRSEYATNSSTTTNLYQCVYAVGAMNNATGTTTLSSQPSFLSKLPSGNYKNLQLWYEQVTASSGVTNITVSYQNQDNNTASATVSIPASTPINRMFQIPLAVGDTGIQKINSVTTTTASGGTYNLRILRPLFSQSCWSGGNVVNMDMSQTGMPEIYPDAALYSNITCSSSASPISIHNIEIAAL